MMCENITLCFSILNNRVVIMISHKCIQLKSVPINLLKKILNRNITCYRNYVNLVKTDYLHNFSKYSYPAMKKDYFILELIKSGPFMLLVILVLIIVLAVTIANHNQHTVQLKEDVMYVAPKPKN